MCALEQEPLCAALFITLCTISCITPNIFHSLCCKLAQLVALSSPSYNVKLSVWLPSSCNTAPLIAKATAQLKEVAVRQPFTQYQILCCYRVSRPGLLNVQWLRELVRVDREGLAAISNSKTIFFFDNQHVTSSSVLQIYTYPVVPKLPKIKTCLSKSRTKWHWSIDSATSNTCWSYESLELVNQ
jgi:hypothetical protein